MSEEKNRMEEKALTDGELEGVSGGMHGIGLYGEGYKVECPGCGRQWCVSQMNASHACPNCGKETYFAW